MPCLVTKCSGTFSILCIVFFNNRLSAAVGLAKGYCQDTMLKLRNNCEDLSSI